MPLFRLLALLIALVPALTPALVLAQAAQALDVAQAAQRQVGVTVHYDPAYVRLPYPGGDVPAERGVCTDVVVRALRVAGVDLQRLVHEDMASAFAAYPQLWKLRKPDRNIDHRRVPNLERFFQRKGKAVAVSNQPSDYIAGDIVSWRLPNGLAHVGVVSSRRSADGLRPMAIHNIGQGAREEDVLFAWRQVGHYRWFTPEIGR